YNIAPEYLINEMTNEDKREVLNIVRYSKEEDSAVVLLPDENGVSHTFRYRYKNFDDGTRKWVALYNSKSNYPYCRLTSDKLTLVVEGSRDFLTALMCGYSVIALPSAGYKLSNELLKDKFVVFIDDDDGKNSMEALFENAICEKILFNHKQFKKITKCNSKDFSDYLYQFTDLKTFKETFEKFIYSEEQGAIDWESNIDNIAKPITLEAIAKAENTEWIFEKVIIKRNITTIVGAPNVGKTAFTFAVANMLLQQGKIDTVLYFDADNPISYVKDRLIKMINTYGENRVRYYNGMTSSAKEMLSILETLSLVSNGSGAKILVVVDSLKFFINGSMNDDKIVSPIYDTLKLLRDRFAPTIIVLHHTRKSKDDEGKLTYNGSQSVEASTDNMLMLTKDYVYHKKSRSDKAGLKLGYSLDFENMIIDISDFVETDESDNDKDDAPCQELISDYLKRNGETSQANLVEILKGKASKKSIKDTLWDSRYRNVLWTVIKDDSLGWVFRTTDTGITYQDETKNP
ncbi:MAG: AAA family ATPase, partial [Epsilonproteobacteria bacterium]|nr:AAA family ATPase [Campylobacterota bacterium]